MANELPTYRQNIRKKIADIRGAGKGGALEKVQKTAEEMKQELEKKDEPAKVQPKPMRSLFKASSHPRSGPSLWTLHPSSNGLPAAGSRSHC